MQKNDRGLSFGAAYEPAARARPVVIRPILLRGLQAAVAKARELFGGDEVAASRRMCDAVNKPDRQSDERERHRPKPELEQAIARTRLQIVVALGKGFGDQVDLSIVQAEAAIGFALGRLKRARSLEVSRLHFEHVETTAAVCAELSAGNQAKVLANVTAYALSLTE